MTETIDPTKLPDPETMQRIGLVHIKWAQLDWLATLGLLNILNIPEHELTVMCGQLDVLAKLKKAKAILLIRRNTVNAKHLQCAISKLDGAKPLRNALTHGLYNGTTSKGEIIYTLLPSVVETADGLAHEMYDVTPHALTRHLQMLDECFRELVLSGFPPMQTLRYAERARTKRHAGVSARPGKSP